jgi:hypothetical protein
MAVQMEIWKDGRLDPAALAAVAKPELRDKLMRAVRELEEMGQATADMLPEAAE